MEIITCRLFNLPHSLDPDSLSGALYLHCRSVEDLLIAGGQVPGVGYVALDVVRVAATLMTAPTGAEDGYARWRLSEPEREALSEDGDHLF